MIPVFIPQKAGTRQVLTDAARFAYGAQGGTVTVDDGDWLWTAKVNRFLLRERSLNPDAIVVVSNNDVRVGPGVLDALMAPFADPNVGVVWPELAVGWLFALRNRWRLDDDLKWWYSDTDLWRRIAKDGYVAAVVDVDAHHLHPNEATFGSPALMLQAQADEATFAAKWGDDPATLFFGRNPHLVLA